MTLAELRAVAEAATPGDKSLPRSYGKWGTAWRDQVLAEFQRAFDPPTVLALLDVVEAAQEFPFKASGRVGDATRAALARLEAME
jgi:hypothetical protein